jgi:hypothetical protein
MRRLARWFRQLVGVSSTCRRRPDRRSRGADSWPRTRLALEVVESRTLLSTPTLAGFKGLSLMT